MICRVCGIEKPESDFYKDKHGKNGLSTKCKACAIEASKKRYWEKRDEIIAYHKAYYSKHKDQKIKQDNEYKNKIQMLKTPCVKCGESRFYVIDFHHVDPSQKSFNINRKSCKGNFSVIEAEVKKCVSLCRNCHAEFHYIYGIKPDNPKKCLAEYLYKGECDGKAERNRS